MTRTKSKTPGRATTRPTPSLIETWFAAETAAPGRRTKTDAVRDLNEACGTSYDLSRINQIAAGKRAHLPREVREYMLARALPRALEAANIKAAGAGAATWRALAQRLA